MMRKRGKHHHQETAAHPKVGRRASKDTGAQKYAFECLEKMNKFRKEGALCDVILEAADGAKFHAHKLVLASSSSYFQAMFTGEMVESRKDHVKLDVQSRTLEVLIDFVYTNKIDVTCMKDAQAVLFSANMLLLHGAESACCDFIGKKITSNNCLNVAEFAEMIANQDLIKSVVGFVQDNFTEVVKRQGFVDLPLRYIRPILASDKLNVRCESEVLSAAIEWINHHESSSPKDLTDVMECIRLPLVPHKVLLDVEENQQELFTSAGCSKYLEEAKIYQLQPEQRSVLHSTRTKPRKNFSQKLCVVGGLAGFEGQDAYLNRLDCAEVRPDMIEDLVWSPKQSMEVARESAAVVALDGLIYIMGGVSYDADVSLVERYNPATDSWTTLAPLNSCKGQVSGCVMGGWLYVVGGTDDGTRQGIKSVEKYHPLENEWKPVPSMRTGRGALGVAVLEDKIYACGGASFNFAFRSVEMYDSIKDKWSSTAPMRESRAFHDVISLRGNLYALGGAEMQDGQLTSIQSTVERYSAATNEWTLIRSLVIPCWGVRAVVNLRSDNSPDEVYIVGKFHPDSGYGTIAKVTIQEDNFLLNNVHFGLGTRIQAGVVLL